MSNAFFEIPIPINEPIKEFREGSIEKKELLDTIQEMKKKEVDIPMIIGGKEIKTNQKIEIRAPHNHKLKLGTFNEGDETHVKMAIDAAIKA